MKKRIVAISILSLLVAGAGTYMTSRLIHGTENRDLLHPDLSENEEEEAGQTKEMKAFYVKQRWMHEFNMLKDPSTGEIPYDIHAQEMKLARSIPEKIPSGDIRVQNLNTYVPAGPNNIGGRTRAVLFDKRYNGTSNRVIISGSVSGGIMRSADGGATWTRVSPDDDIHNVTVLAQDPRAGAEDTWYAGGGEPIAGSASAAGAFYLSFGVWKSTNNGVTWTKLPRQATDIDGTTVLGQGTLEAFDNPFDIIHKIAVNPVNGDVYVCGHRRLLRSTNGGTSWNVVFTGSTATTSDLGQMDLVVTNTGRLYLGVNGGLPDTDKRGVWTSANGTSWSQLAGGSVLGVDSVAQWKGNSYDGGSKRIVMALAPSSQNLLYVTYENGESQAGSSGKPEADLYKYDANGPAWTNLSANVPDFPGQMDGVDPFHIQGGYDLMVSVKPDDPNTVFLGGVNLYRSTNGFSSTANTTWIGGYGSNFASALNIYGSQNNPGDITKWSHPDMHVLVFDPSNSSHAICGNDGGLQQTSDIMANAGGLEPVTWNVFQNYQTLQYYHVAMDPGEGRLNFVGGAQDNGTRFRDGTGVLGTITNNAQYRLLSGDGAAAAIAKANGGSQVVYGATQFGNIIRATLSSGGATGGTIRPNGLTAVPGISGAFGDFVTYFKIDFDNTEDLYYVNFNRLFRTTSATTVTSSTWTELTGVRSTVNPASPTNGTNISITALEMTRGPYFSNHALYIGTSNGRIYRLDDPRNALASASPVNITPPGLNAQAFVSDIAVNPNDDNEIMVVTSNYGITSIFWTKTAKAATPTWFSAEGNLGLPSIRSCAIVVKKDGSNNPVTEYYVGTSVGLYSAVEIGSLTPSGSVINVTWVREGGSVLNFAVINSVDYRPQDNYLLIGTHGNGMYYAQTGTPDFRPNQATGIPDPVRNDRNFIVKAFPTVTSREISYQAGTMLTVKKLVIRIHNLNGQLVWQSQAGYSNGQVDVRKLASGSYILSITSDDYKQQFVQKFVKQ